MADNVPKHNKNIVFLTELLQDPVSGADNGVKAATDGSVYSSTYRELCMADGYKWVGNEVIKRVADKDRVQDLISGLIVNATLSQVTAGIAVKSDYLETLAVVRSTSSTPPYKYILPSLKDQADMDNLPDLKRCYTIYGGVLYSYTRTNQKLTADNSISLIHKYFKLERINYDTGALIAANTTDSRTADITLNPQWFDSAVLYAAYLAKSRLGDGDAVNDCIRFKTMAQDSLLGTIG